MKKKLLLTGASGFLGYHLMRVAAPDWEIYGLTHSNTFNFKDAVAVKCDITNYIETGNYFDDIEPDAVIHAAAISNANFCQQNKEVSNAINVEASINLAGICSDYNIPFGFISTDLVFDGKKGMYTEEDERNPVSVYGEQKAKAEDEVLHIYPSATVFRVPFMFGTPEASSANYLLNFLKQARNGEAATLFTDEYRSVCGARNISEGIIRLLGNYTGTIHLAGKERLSRYEFGVEALRAFQLSEDLAKAVSQKEVPMAAPRPADVSMDISKAVQLGYSPVSVKEELKLIAANQYV